MVGIYDSQGKESCGSEGEGSLAKPLGVPLWMLGVMRFVRHAPSLPSPLGQPCTPPSEPRGPGAQPFGECTTGWLSPRQLVWAK
jgi:hypothetical protein